MTGKNRVGGANRIFPGLAFVAVILMALALAGPAVGAEGVVRIIGSGGSDELVPPPSPTCDDLVFITEVSFDAQGNPIDIPRFGSSADLTQVFDVPGFEPVGPGRVVLNEVITFDGHIGRVDGPAQTQEQVYFEFLLDGASQTRSPLTPDVPDSQRTGWVDIDMGVYDVPNGADTLRIHHVGGDPADINSVVVSALCGRFEEIPEEVSTTTVPATTVPPTTTIPPATTEPPATTTAPTTTVATEVLQETEEQDLAVTGADHDALVRVAFASILLGFAYLGLGRVADRTAARRRT